MRTQRWMAVALIVVGLGLAGCQRPPTGGEKISPAKVEAVSGKTVKSVTLTAEAANRLGIERVEIVTPPPAPAGQPGTTTAVPYAVVPYAAVLYDANGVTWVYTVTSLLKYVREKVVVANVGGPQGTLAYLSEGPAAGTTVVTTGVMELYGAELGVGKK